MDNLTDCSPTFGDGSHPRTLHNIIQSLEYMQFLASCITPHGHSYPVLLSSLPHSQIFGLILPWFFSVYCCCCLANISIPGVGVAVPEFRPFFYVNVADISALENELSYVACEWVLETSLTFAERHN